MAPKPLQIVPKPFKNIQKPFKNPSKTYCSSRLLRQIAHKQPQFRLIRTCRAIRFPYIYAFLVAFVRSVGHLYAPYCPILRCIAPMPPLHCPIQISLKRISLDSAYKKLRGFFHVGTRDITKTYIQGIYRYIKSNLLDKKSV